jgi:hypothetical protein
MRLFYLATGPLPYPSACLPRIPTDENNNCPEKRITTIYSLRALCPGFPFLPFSSYFAFLGFLFYICLSRWNRLFFLLNDTPESIIGLLFIYLYYEMMMCRSELLELLRGGHLDDLDLELEEQQETGLLGSIKSVFKK